MDLDDLDYKELVYRICRPFYVEMGAKLADDPDDDQIMAIVVVKRWHPGWWLLKRKMARVDRAFVGGHSRGRVK